MTATALALAPIEPKVSPLARDPRTLHGVLGFVVSLIVALLNPREIFAVPV